MKNLNNKIAKGAAWMVLFKLVDRSLGLISTLVLVRVLLPADFGLISMAMTFIGALNLLVNFSFDVALIQNPNAGRDEFDTAWTFNVLFAVGCAALMAFTAPSVAAFYREARLTEVIYSLAIGFAVQGFSNIGSVAFRRDMQFNKEFKFLLGKRLATCVTIPLALYLQNYWALVVGQLTGTFLSVALSYVVSDYRPRFCMRAKVELFHTSKWLMLNNIILFFNKRAGQFVIGRVSGAESLGMYNIAAEISMLPTTELVAPINRAAFPGYAKAKDTDELRTSFLRVIASIALFALPAGIGIVVVADLLVPAALGWKWLSAIPVIQILAIFGTLEALQTNIGYVYLAQGRARMVTWCAGLQSLLRFALLIPGIYYFGVIGAAYAALGTILIFVPVNQFLVARCLQLSGVQFLGSLYRPFFAALVMAGAVLLVKANLVLREVTLDYVLALFLCAVVGAAVYVAVVYLMWRGAGRPPGPEEFTFARLAKVLRKLGVNLRLVSR